MYEDIIQGTLEWCNSKRKEKGMEPLEVLPKGEREDGNSCPCGKATGLYVSQTIYLDEDPQLLMQEHEAEIYENQPERRLPQAVVDFVKAFDRGEIPELDEHYVEEDDIDWMVD